MDRAHSPDDSLGYHGGAVKALGEGKVGGYIVRFGTPETADCQGEYFTADTQFNLDVADRVEILYHHGFTRKYGAERLGVAGLALKADGVWAEGQLDMGSPKPREVYVEAEAGKLGWSSGCADRQVIRESVKGARWLRKWPISEATLSRSPVDGRNRAYALKALIESPGQDGPVPAPSLLDRTEGLVSELEVVVGLYRDAVKARQSVGRNLSLAKRDALKSLRDTLAELVEAADPDRDARRLAALRRSLLAARLD